MIHVNMKNGINFTVRSVMSASRASPLRTSFINFYLRQCKSIRNIQCKHSHKVKHPKHQEA